MRLLLSSAALAIALATPAAAENSATIRIDTTGYNLASAEDRAAIEAEIEGKLREACKLETARRFSYGSAVVDYRCVAQARSEALAQLERIAANQTRSGGAIAAN